jgi:predicted nucleic acid-binding protein
MIVVDTNVMVFLLTGVGPGEEAARHLRRDAEWAAPGLLLSELRNVLAGLVRTDRMDAADAAEICQDAEEILAGRLASMPSDQVLAEALKEGLSVYDAEFVVLARRLGVPLLTADRAIGAAAPDVAVGL